MPESTRIRLTRRALLRSVAGVTVFAAVPELARAATGAVYRDARAPIELRVRDLLGRMTLEEKVAQLVTAWDGKGAMLDEAGKFDPVRAAGAYPHGIGQVARASDRHGIRTGRPDPATGSSRSPADTIAFVNAAQDWARRHTRLGIPILVHEEVLHGYMAPGATSFPQAIALAGSFDPALVRRVNAVIAREARAHGAILALSPVVDIARDPRWGRIEETFGEDPYLCGEMGVAAVQGLQGEGRTLGRGKVFATLKHMTGHGQPQAGNNVAPAQLGERELRESYFPPFRAVVERTGIGAVMPSYNEIDGVPSHRNRWLLTDVLRGEWKFDGVVVSDYMAVPELASLHHVAPDKAAAARLALLAGVDAELPDGETFPALVAEVRAGRVPEAAVDAACMRMLRLKFRAGLFEAGPLDPAAAARLTANAEAIALAREAAAKSIVLLKNNGLLPLEPGAHQRVAVIGPNAAVARLGGYSSIPAAPVSLLEGVRAQLAGKAEVLHAQGVYITQSENRSDDEVRLADRSANLALIAEAVETAKRADIVLLAIGDTEQTSREGFSRTHLGDRTSLDLVGEQNALFAALKETGKPIVVVAINGRPPSWPAVVAGTDAMIECWYPGQQGGHAIADVLFGVVNPGAKLPVTVVREVGQVPFYYNHKPSARRGYLFADPEPLFPFGFGLSYTRFEISAPRLSAARISVDGTVDVFVEVSNRGARAGDEVVQLYLRDQVASVSRPVKELRGFERVSLQPGETRTLRFQIGPEALRMWDGAMREVVEPGLFDIMVGPNSRDCGTTVLEVA